MPTFSTENTLSLEPKSPPGVFACSTTRLLYCSPVLLSPLACSTIYFLLTSRSLQPTKRLAEVNASTKQHLLCKTKPIYQPLLMTVTSALTSTYEHKPPLEPPKNKANPKPIGKKAATLAKLHQIRATSSELHSSVPTRHLWPGFPRYRPPGAHKTTPFMQNKANFRRHDNDCNLSYNKHLRR